MNFSINRISVSTRADDAESFLIFGQTCRPILEGLFDDRLWAPETFAMGRCSPATLHMVPKRAGYEITVLHTFTPALWMARSLCVSLCSREGRTNRVMRSAPMAAGLTLAARALVLPWFRHLNRSLTGNCLMVMARGQEG
jgi:hypothetical protein